MSKQGWHLGLSSALICVCLILSLNKCVSIQPKPIGAQVPVPVIIVNDEGMDFDEIEDKN